jgi:phage-related protein
MPVVYYPSTTPTDTEITNEALIEQLEAVLGGHTYAGTNNIFTITPNEQGTLEISYYTKYQLMVVGGGYVWEAGGAGGATIVVNNSIDSVNPIWKIYGPTMNPQLENSTTGEVIEYVGLIAEGQTLTIDMGEQTASLDGLNVISNLVGDFISLAPGANRLIYSVSGDAGASEIGWSEIVG